MLLPQDSAQVRKMVCTLSVENDTIAESTWTAPVETQQRWIAHVTTKVEESDISMGPLGPANTYRRTRVNALTVSYVELWPIG